MHVDEESLILATPVGYSAEETMKFVRLTQARLKHATADGTLKMRKIPTNLRRHVRGFLRFDSAQEKRILDAVIEGGPILFVDDFETT